MCIINLSIYNIAILDLDVAILFIIAAIQFAKHLHPKSFGALGPIPLAPVQTIPR